MAYYGVAAADAQAVVEMAIGGKAATQLYEGERKFDIRIRYLQEFRDDQEKIEKLMVPSIDGVTKVPLKEIADFRKVIGPAFIYRDNNMRNIFVNFSVRNRDLGGTIAEAQEKVGAAVTVPKGYQIAWNGEFENQRRAEKTLEVVVPICLLAIFIILFTTFGNVKDALLVMLSLPFAVVGGIWALQITGMNFSISAGIGFIALFGICIQNLVIIILVFRHNLEQKMPLEQAIKEGVRSRTRAVVMTALMAAIGLTPAAISHGIGSESQKPLARVVIGGLGTATILALFVLPVVYGMIHRFVHKRKNRKIIKKFNP